MGMFDTDGLKVYIDPENFFIVDEEDEWVTDHNWRMDSKGYLVRGKRIKGKYRQLRMHRVIMEYHGWDIDGLVVDHINHERNDNRKSNLRVCTKEENQRNRRSKNKIAGYKGVTYNKRKGLYEARIQVEHKSIFIGAFPNARLAAHWYNEAARDLHGEYAELNDLTQCEKKY